MDNVEQYKLALKHLGDISNIDIDIMVDYITKVDRVDIMRKYHLTYDRLNEIKRRTCEKMLSGLIKHFNQCNELRVERISRQQVISAYEKVLKDDLPNLITESVNQRLQNGGLYMDNISNFDFSVRAKNILHKAGFKTMQDILDFGIDNLPKLRDCGKTTLDEVRDVFYREYGIIS